MQEKQELLAELEEVHKSGTIEADRFFKQHGDSIELKTMRIALSHIADKIAELRSELTTGLQAINKDVDELSDVMQVCVQEIKKDVEELNVKLLDGLQNIEQEVKELTD